MKLQKTIPFKFWPGAWGLSGNTRAIAEAEYYYDGYELEIELAKINLKDDEDKLAIAQLNIDLKYDKISQQKFDRKFADLTGKPFMAMPKIEWSPTDSNKTYMELDYNEHFVAYLEKNGYSGTEETIINKWLNDICNSILDEMASNEPEFVRTVKSIRRDDGKTEHM